MALFTVTGRQLAINSILIAVTTTALVSAAYLYKERESLPEVHLSKKDNACIKVVNFQNGDAYGCPDVDVILRKYRKVLEEPEQTTEKHGD